MYRSTTIWIHASSRSAGTNEYDIDTLAPASPAANVYRPMFVSVGGTYCPTLGLVATATSGVPLAYTTPASLHHIPCGCSTVTVGGDPGCIVAASFWTRYPAVYVTWIFCAPGYQKPLTNSNIVGRPGGAPASVITR